MYYFFPKNNFLKKILFTCLFFFTISGFANAQPVNTQTYTHPIPGCPYVFTRNLQVGNKGIDVKVLQQILNSDSRTRVADSGPGSKGQESTVFGSGTREALKRFQALFYEYVGTANGKVDSRTATILNNICSVKKKPETVSKDTTPPQVQLSSATKNLSKTLKINLSSTEPIKKPSIRAVICDGCQVSDIRKISNLNYIIVINPLDGAKLAEVQIEAEQIEDMVGNRNLDASNILTFKQNIISQTVSKVIDIASDMINTVTETATEPEPIVEPVEPEKNIQESYPPADQNQIFNVWVGSSNGVQNLVAKNHPSTINWDFQTGNPSNNLAQKDPSSNYCIVLGANIDSQRFKTTAGITVNPTFTTKYDIVCYGPNNYKAKKSVFIDVDHDNNSTPLNLSVSKPEVKYGEEIQLFVNTDNTNTIPANTNCVLNGGIFNNYNLKLVTGTTPQTIAKVKVYKRTIYNIRCTVANKIYSDSVGIRPAKLELSNNLNQSQDASDYSFIQQIMSQNFMFGSGYLNNNVYPRNFVLPLRNRFGQPEYLCGQNYTIDWGDNSEQQIGQDYSTCNISDFKHDYLFDGSYTISVHGQDGRIYFLHTINIGSAQTNCCSSDGP